VSTSGSLVPRIMVEQVRKNVEVELQPILDHEEASVSRQSAVESRPSRPRTSILNNPVFKASFRNLVLIVTWYGGICTHYCFLRSLKKNMGMFS
jgi:hypothetical protein